MAIKSSREVMNTRSESLSTEEFCEWNFIPPHKPQNRYKQARYKPG